MVAARRVAANAGGGDQRRERVDAGAFEFPSSGRNAACGAEALRRGGDGKSSRDGATPALAQHQCPGSFGAGGWVVETPALVHGSAPAHEV